MPEVFKEVLKLRALMEARFPQGSFSKLFFKGSEC